MPNQVQQRSPIAVALLPFVTFGIYSWYWYVKVKGELNQSQNQVHIPTAFVWLIPFVGGIWYMWKFSQATEIVTGGKYSTPIAFLLLFVLGTWLGGAILQDAFNNCNANAQMASPQQPPYGSQTTFNNYYGQPTQSQFTQTPPANTAGTNPTNSDNSSNGFPPAA